MYIFRVLLYYDVLLCITFLYFLLFCIFYYFCIMFALLWPPVIGKDPDAGKDWGKEKIGGDGGWEGWMTPLTQWTWVWENSRRQWGTGKSGLLQSKGLQRVDHDLVTEQEYFWDWKLIKTLVKAVVAIKLKKKKALTVSNKSEFCFIFFYSNFSKHLEKEKMMPVY